MCVFAKCSVFTPSHTLLLSAIYVPLFCVWNMGNGWNGETDICMYVRACMHDGLHMRTGDSKCRDLPKYIWMYVLVHTCAGQLTFNGWQLHIWYADFCIAIKVTVRVCNIGFIFYATPIHSALAYLFFTWASYTLHTLHLRSLTHAHILKAKATSTIHIHWRDAQHTAFGIRVTPTPTPTHKNIIHTYRTQAKIIESPSPARVKGKSTRQR